MQRIDFITHFFRKILQRNNKLVIFGNLDMLGHIHLKRYYQFEESFIVYLQAKTELHPSHFIFLEILERYSKLVNLGTLGMPAFGNLKRYYQLIENVCDYLQAKKQLHCPCFSGDIANICKLLILDTLGKLGYAHPKR